jgi:hypothetical protein
MEQTRGVAVKGKLQQGLQIELQEVLGCRSWVQLAQFLSIAVPTLRRPGKEGRIRNRLKNLPSPRTRWLGINY